MTPPSSLRQATGRRAPAAAALAVALTQALAACAGHVAPPARPTVPVLPPPVAEADLAQLRARRLLVPVAGVRARGIPDTFADARGSDRVHQAIDILAPRGTPVLAADDGRIWRLRSNALGGITVYATDPAERFVYYYAHLERYRDGLLEGMPIVRGDTLGFVGTTGNAPPDVPHLHFQVARIGPDRRWWTGTPIDPLPFLREQEPARSATVPAPRTVATRTVATRTVATPAARGPARPTVPALPPDSAAATDTLLAPAATAAGAPRAAARGVAPTSAPVGPPPGEP